MEETARRLHAEGAFEAAAAGALACIDALRILATLQPLPSHPATDNLQKMTGAQLERRGKAIARGKAAKDELLRAIVASKWATQDAYATKRLKVSPGSLTAYR